MYPLITYCDAQGISDAQQRCTLILFVMVIVGVAVHGVGLIVSVVSVNIATLISRTREIARAVHKRPPKITIDCKSAALVEVCRQSSMHA